LKLRHHYGCSKAKHLKAQLNAKNANKANSAKKFAPFAIFAKFALSISDFVAAMRRLRVERDRLSS
jgi:hypothetical protein